MNPLPADIFPDLDLAVRWADAVHAHDFRNRVISPDPAGTYVSAGLYCIRRDDCTEGYGHRGPCVVDESEPGIIARLMRYTS